MPVKGKSAFAHSYDLNSALGLEQIRPLSKNSPVSSLPLGTGKKIKLKSRSWQLERLFGELFLVSVMDIVFNNDIMMIRIIIIIRNRFFRLFLYTIFAIMISICK